MLEIKTMLQENLDNNFKCGAYSLQAVFSYYGVEKTVDEVWSEIATLRPGTRTERYATTDKLAKYSNSCGISATIYKSKDILHTLDVLDELSKTAILVVAHKKPGDPVGHFIVYKGRKDGDYIFADPEKTKDRRMTPLQIRDYCKATGTEVYGNILIAFGEMTAEYKCEFCGHSYPLVNVDTLRDAVSGSICCHCNRGKVWQ